MITVSEERRSQGPLIVFIDLLFLLIAFFVLMLFFVRGHQEVSEQALETMQKNLARITGEEMNVPEALTQLETMVDRFMADQDRVLAQQREIALKRQRRARRETFVLEYTINDRGEVLYEHRLFTPQRFLRDVVEPMRETYWVAFRASADPKTPFGQVIANRRILLRDSNEFDTYWDNISRKRSKEGKGGESAKGKM